MTVVFISASFFGVTFPLSAQTVEPLYYAEITAPQVPEAGIAPASTTIDETTILFDDPLPAAQAAGRSTTFVVVQMVLVLALAALAIYGVVFFFKRLARPQESRDPHLKLLARVPLSSDSYAAVVSLGGKAWLVGGGSGGLNLISEVTDVETLETLLLDDARKNAEADMRGFMDFQSLLQRFRGAMGNRKMGMPPGSSHTSTASFPGNGSLSEKLRKQRERLGGL